MAITQQKASGLHSVGTVPSSRLWSEENIDHVKNMCLHYYLTFFTGCHLLGVSFATSINRDVLKAQL